MSTLPEPLAHPGYGGMVTGQWYQITLLGADDWYFWVPRKLKRKELRPVALQFVNPDVYASQDIDSVRAIKRMTV